MNTETENTRTVETANEPIIAPAPFLSLIKPGIHSATVIGASIKRNQNGKLHVAMDYETESRIVNHQMYLTTNPGTANAAKQLKDAFGIESFKDVPSIVGQKCGLRIEHEEYNGRIQAKVRYINPDNNTEAGEINLDKLDEAFTAPTSLDVAF